MTTFQIIPYHIMEDQEPILFTVVEVTRLASQPTTSTALCVCTSEAAAERICNALRTPQQPIQIERPTL